jgi:hypothetical protein
MFKEEGKEWQKTVDPKEEMTVFERTVLLSVLLYLVRKGL